MYNKYALYAINTCQIVVTLNFSLHVYIYIIMQLSNYHFEITM